MSNKVPLAHATKESVKPKSVAKPKDMILDPMGQWKHPGQNTRIPSNNITMKGVPYPVLAKPNVGQPIMMQPGAHYTFPGADYVDEFPKFAGGGMVEATVDENGKPRCPDGYDYNSSTGYCEKKSSKCPDGYKPDGKGGCIEDRCQPGYVKDASGTCVPDTSGAIYVDDENDPRYQDYLTRKKLHHISNIEHPELRKNAYYNMKQGYDTYDEFYDPEKGYIFDNIKTENGKSFLYNKDNFTVASLYNIDPNKGDYDSKREIYKGLTIDQARNLEAYARSKGFDMGDQFDPYGDADYKPDQFTEKYKPSKFDADVYYINSVTPNFSFDRSAGKYLEPKTAIVEDEINRERLKKYYPNITDEDINDDYTAYYNSYISNIKDNYNSPWPYYTADPEIAKKTDVLAADGSDITMDEHKKNIQDSAKAPNVINAPLNVEYDEENNPIIKGRRTSYKPENVEDYINTTGRVLPYYDAPTDNYKFVTQPKSAELIQETQRAVPKFDEPELNLKKGNQPSFKYVDPLHDVEYIRLKKGARPIAKWNPYSAALRMFTGYKGDPFTSKAKEGSSKQKLLTEIKEAREEDRPVNFKGIPVGSKTELKDRRLYKKAVKDYEKRLPAIELENEKRRKQHEEELIKLNLQRQAEEDKRNAVGLDPNALTEWKKGGGLKSKKYSKSILATNRLFAEHPLFEKPKKLSKKRIYDNNAFYYQFGGLAKNNSNVYFNPSYDNTFTGGTNSYETYSDKFPVYKNQRSAVVGIEGSLGKRDIRSFMGNGWKYNAYAGLPYNAIKDKNYIPSAGIMLDYQNKPQDKKFSPQVQIAADYNSTDGLGVTATGGARFPLIGYSRKLKPGTGGGNIDVYGGARLGANKDNFTGGLIYGSRIQGRYQPRWLDKLSKGSYFYGDAGIQFDPVKGKGSQKETAQGFVGGTDPITGTVYNGTMQAKDPGTKWGATGTVNVGIKKDIDRIKFDNDKRTKKIQDIEDREIEYERERPVKPVEQKEPEEQKEWIGEHPRWLQKGGMTAMMKARLAYANEFGNPAAKRMINIPDNPYEFENGDTGTHYMSSMDNYAVPQIQDENGQLMLGDYGPDSREAMRFDSDEDADYFAEHYKDVSPGFMELELSDDEIQEYAKGGYIVEDISVPELSGYAEGGQPCSKGMIWSSDLGRCISETDYFMNEMRGQAQRVQEMKDLGLGDVVFDAIDTGALKDIEINRGYNKAYNWTGDYMDSPRYKEMVLKSVKGDRKKADELMKARQQNYKNTSPLIHGDTYPAGFLIKPQHVAAFANPWLNKISITDLGAKWYEPSTLIHEISHGVDSQPVSDMVSNKRSGKTNIGRLIPKSDLSYIRKKADIEKGLKKKDDNYIDSIVYNTYLSEPTEVRARLNEIREAGNYNSIYDPLKEKVNTKTFNKLKKLNSGALNNLKHIYSDKEIKKMLNTISKNESEPVDEYAPQMAKYGGTTNYQLGDEIDEATMKRLKKLGYTFEKI
jgi:hypothetical protein